jgi:hypothetical protein
VDFFKEQLDIFILHIIDILGNWDPTSFTVDDVFRATLLILELAILEERAQMKGGVCIVDCQNISMQHALCLTPSLAQKLLQMAVVS